MKNYIYAQITGNGKNECVSVCLDWIMQPKYEGIEQLIKKQLSNKNVNKSYWIRIKDLFFNKKKLTNQISDFFKAVLNQNSHTTSTLDALNNFICFSWTFPMAASATKAPLIRITPDNLKSGWTKLSAKVKNIKPMLIIILAETSYILKVLPWIRIPPNSTGISLQHLNITIVKRKRKRKLYGLNSVKTRCLLGWFYFYLVLDNLSGVRLH